MLDHLSIPKELHLSGALFLLYHWGSRRAVFSSFQTLVTSESPWGLWTCTSLVLSQKFFHSSRSGTVALGICVFHKVLQGSCRWALCGTVSTPQIFRVACLTLFRAQLTWSRARPLISSALFTGRSCCRPEVSWGPHRATRKAFKSMVALNSWLASFFCFFHEEHGEFCSFREWHWQTSNLTLTFWLSGSWFPHLQKEDNPTSEWPPRLLSRWELGS